MDHVFVCTRVDSSNSFLYGKRTYSHDRLQSVQRSAARLILTFGKYSAAIRRDLHCPNRYRVQFMPNSITSICLAVCAPEYLIELCHSVNDIPAKRNIRSLPRFSSWFLDIGRNAPVAEVFPSPHHSCGIYFLPISDFSTTNINSSDRD